jgi:hypothetical protein
MVHVSSAGGRHKMLAFASTEPILPPTIDAIITVNTKDGSLNGSSSSPSPSSSSTSEPAIIHAELNRELHIIAEEPNGGGGVSSLIHHNNHNFNAIHNGTSKMNQNEDGNNGNANYLADSLNSNRNMNAPGMTNDGLKLISHGLTDSVCESLKLLDTENDNETMRLVEHNRVFTEEIVLSKTSPSSAGKKGIKGGIMKTTAGHTCATHSAETFISEADEWQKDHIDDGGQIHDSEDAPLIPPSTTKIDVKADGDSSSLEKKHVMIINDSPTNASPVGTAKETPTGSCPQVNHKLSKLSNGAKQAGLKR